MNDEAKPRVDVTTLANTKKTQKALGRIRQYAERYYQVQGKYPSHVTIGKEDYRAFLAEVGFKGTTFMYGSVLVRVAQ